jgi:hypothetical protein
MNKLTQIQSELKAPKNQYNSFGKYKYRNCEDILEAVKPLLAKYDCKLIITDEVINIGARFYIKATAKFKSEDGVVEVSAMAREEESKKGMDGSQVSGAASSYARKYCLNGLFLIDDTKDADSEAPIKQRTEAEILAKISFAKDKADLTAIWQTLSDAEKSNVITESFKSKALTYA